MTLDLLDAPLRVTWDLHGPKGPADRLVVRKVGEALATAGVFFVFLEQRPLLHPDFAAALHRLKSGGCRVTALCSGVEAELQALDPKTLPDDLLLDAGGFLDATGFDEPALAGVLERLRDRGGDPGLLLQPSSENLQFLPRLADFCRTFGLSRFKLPNLRISANLATLPGKGPLTPAQIAAFGDALGRERESVSRGLQLEVHDLFLWEVLFPDGGGQRSEYGGCQAGNSLGHVDAEGTVLPCTSWPKPLGSLADESLEGIWASPARHEIRRQIGSLPAGCAGCRDLPVCFGGCRGLALSGYGHQGRDPGCAGPR